MKRFSCLLFLVVIVSSGCAVLTPSQVAEVEKFAKATSTCSSMPPEVMKTQAELRAKVKLANASSALSGDSALKLLKEAEQYEREVGKLAVRAKIACTVLENYGNLLSTLTSNEPLAKLQASADELGDKVDSAISKYNDISGKSMDTFGGAVAAVVRGAGGLYIKRKQTIALKQAVEDGKPAVAEMTAAISKLLELYNNPKPEMELISPEKDALIEWYRLAGFREPLSTTLFVMDEIEKAESAIALAKESSVAVAKLETAHAQLAAKLEKKMELKETVETIQVFVDEVKAAKESYDKLSKK